MELEILLRAFLKGDVRRRRQGLFSGLLGAFILAGIERINSILQQLPRLAGAFARFFKREVIDRP